MKNLIPSESLLNRKLILEIRFNPNPQIVDNRGKMLAELLKSKIINNAHWQMGDGTISMTDAVDPNIFTKRCYIDTQIFSLISQINHTNESFYNDINTLYNIVTQVTDIDIVRIGCRIQGTYSTVLKSYEKILDGFLNLFPSQFILEDFEKKDLNFLLVYRNGQYSIGPIAENDNWTKQQFPNEEIRNNKMGFAIDTDNYILKVKPNNLNKINFVKDVFLTSLSVEKSLFEKLNKILVSGQKKE